MAKTKFQASKLDFDDNLDFDFEGLGGPEHEEKDDRHPTIKAFAAVGKEAKEFATNSNNIEKFLKAALPQGYGEAYDLASEARDELAGLYNNVSKDLEPAATAAKSMARKHLPKMEGKLPQGILKKLKDLAGEEDHIGGYSQQKSRESDLPGLLGEIFGNQVQERVRQREETNKREQIRQGFEQIRHRDQIAQLDEIREATQALQDYNNKVVYNYQRKSLELSYRQYWAMADLAQEQKISNQKILQQLKATVKNTGLPDYVKTKTSERFGEITRNRFLEGARDRFVGGARDYIRNFTKNIGSQLKVATTGISGMATMANMGDGMDFGDSDKQSGLETIVRFLAGQGLDYGSEFAAEKIRDRLSQNRDVRKRGLQAQYQAGRVDEIVHDHLMDPTKTWGLADPLKRFLAQSAPARTTSARIEVDNNARGMDPKPFSRNNSKSIDEIIPGLLARIYREIKVLRTGDESVELISYDYTKNKFTTERGAAESVKSLFKGRASDQANEKVNKLLDQIDPSGKLTKEQREIARKNIIERSLTGGSMDASKVFMGSQWGGGEDGRAIANTFNRYLRSSGGKLSDTEGSIRRQVSIAEQFKGLQNGIADPRPLVQTLVNLGQREMLIRAGVLREDNEIDRRALAKLLAGEDSGQQMFEEAAGFGSYKQTTQGVASTSGGSNLKGLGKVTKAINKNSATARLESQKQLEALQKLNMGPASQLQAAAMAEQKQLLQSMLEIQERANPEVVQARIKSIDETLKSIEELLSTGTGLQLQAFDQLIAAAKNQASNGEDGASDLSAKRSFTSLWEHATTVGREKFDNVKRGAMRLYDKYKGPLGRKLESAANRIQTAGTNLRNKLSDRFGDVYIDGERYPRLTIGKLKAGQYFDKATGAVINSFDDIRGDVVDEFGNVVLSFDELKNAYVGGGWNKKLTELLKTGVGKLANLRDLATTLIPTGVQQVIAMSKNAASRVKNLLPPYDVYLKTDMKRPLLYANLMRYDKYYSKHSSKVIRHPRDIDGEVVDDKGNIIVGEDELRIGLVDVNGAPIGSLAKRLMAKAGKILSSGWGALTRVGGAALGAIGQYMEKFKGFFAELFVPFKDILTHSKRSVELLENIYNLLDERLPGGKKVRGDLDGDGIRDGSLEDIRRKREASKGDKEAKAAAEEEKRNPGIMSKLLAGIGSMFGFGKKGKDDEEDDDDGDDDESNWLSDAADAAEIYDAVNGDGNGNGNGREKRGTRSRNRRARKLRKARAKARLPKTTGRFGRLGRFFGRGAVNTGGVRALGGVAQGAGRIVGNTAGAIGRGAMAIGKTGPAQALGRGAMAAGRWGAVNPVLVRGLGAGLGAVGTAIGATAGGIGSVLGSGAARTAGAAGLRALGFALSWPVSLALTAGYVGYKAYEYSKKTKLTILSKIRLAQYGFLAENDEWAEKIFALEQFFEPHATIAEDGNLIVDRKKLDLNDVADLIGIKSRTSMEMFNRWYDSRFVPVFRRHLTELRKIDKEGKLSKVESIVPGKDKMAYVQRTISDLEQAHNYQAGLVQSLPKLQTDNAYVRQLVEDSKTELAKEAEKNGGPKATATAKEVVASTVANADKLAEAAVSDRSKYDVRDKDGNKVISLDAKDLAERIKKGDVTVEVAVQTPKELLHVDSKRLDALTSIRMKAYGLTEMSVDKVRILGALERTVNDFLTPGTDNIRLKAESTKIVEEAGAAFGLQATRGARAERWKTWFNGRFLPVYLMYVGAMRRLTGKEDLKQALAVLPIGKQLELARQLTAAKGIDSRGVSRLVWEIPDSPWEDYPLNDNPDSCAGNIEAIRLLADKATLGEVTTKVATNRETDESKPAFGWYNTGKRSIQNQNTRNGIQSNKGVGMQATGDEFVSAGGAAGENAVGGGQRGISAGGSKISITGGSGGMMGDMPSGSGSGWQAMKEIIIKAAKMAGVDAKSLASFIAVESGFNPNAMPPVGKNGKRASSAMGLGQFLRGTWSDMIRKYGRKFGIPADTSPLDPRANALMTAMYMKDNTSFLQGSLKRDVSVVDSYFAHFLGPGGARTLLSANPNSIGRDIAPEAARSNPGIFFADGRALTVAEIYNNVKKKIEGRAKEHGVSDSDFQGIEASAEGVKADQAASNPAPVSTAQSEQAEKYGMKPVGASPSSSQGQGSSSAAVSPNSMPSVGSPSLNGTVTRDTSVQANMTPSGPAMRPLSGNAKYTLTLRREKSEDDGTYGVLQFPDGTSLMTIELPWIENKPRISCIPPGTYRCEIKQSPKFGASYEVKNVPNRSAILIHAGNSAGNSEKGMKADSLGCILLGMGRGRKGNQKIITGSKAAMQAFYEKMANQPFMLNIIGGEASSPDAAQAKMAENIEAIKGSAPVPATSIAKPAVSAAAMPSFTPTQPSSSQSQGSQQGSSIPLMNPAPRAPISMGFTPTSTEMKNRDNAINKEIAPKMDIIADTLSRSLIEQQKSSETLSKIYEALKNSNPAQASAETPKESDGKMQFQGSKTSPVAPRRNY